VCVSRLHCCHPAGGKQCISQELLCRQLPTVGAFPMDLEGLERLMGLEMLEGLVRLEGLARLEELERLERLEGWWC